ncbi:MAG: hypothetical protein P4L50_03105 [Anaerolineaceae bacterium]|nr:hypothetical protein [Anaerolineaceae bacterium]
MKTLNSPNYTQMPNDLFDLMPEMGEAEFRVVVAICRLTFGFHLDEARKSLTGIQKMTGLSRQGVLDGAEEAEKRGLISRIQDGGVTIWKVNLSDELVNVVDQASQPSRPEVVNPVDQSGQHSRPPSNKENIKEIAKEKEHAETKKTVSAPPTGIIKNQSTFDALKKFEDRSRQQDDFSKFPEDVQAIIKEVCSLWKLSPPATTGKGGQFALWIKEGRFLREACGELGLKAIQAAYISWQKNPFTVGRPGALITTTRAEAGKLRAHPTIPERTPEQLESFKKEFWSRPTLLKGETIEEFRARTNL